MEELKRIRRHSLFNSHQQSWWLNKSVTNIAVLLPVTVWAKTNVDVLIIKQDDLILLCQKEKQFLLNLFNDAANKFTFISKKLMYLQFKSLQDKILVYLSRALTRIGLGRSMAKK